MIFAGFSLFTNFQWYTYSLLLFKFPSLLLFLFLDPLFCSLLFFWQITMVYIMPTTSVRRKTISFPQWFNQIIFFFSPFSRFFCTYFLFPFFLFVPILPLVREREWTGDVKGEKGMTGFCPCFMSFICVSACISHIPLRFWIFHEYFPTKVLYICRLLSDVVIVLFVVALVLVFSYFLTCRFTRPFRDSCPTAMIL